MQRISRLIPFKTKHSIILTNTKLMKRIVILSLLLSLFCISSNAQKWVTTWASAQQLTEPHNLPPEPFLAGNSYRQIIQVSIGGEEVRLRLSNEWSDSPLEIKGIEIARALTPGATYEIDEATTVALTFDGGSKSVVIPAGEWIYAQPVKFHLDPRQSVAITVHYGEMSNKSVSGHPASRTNSYLAVGNTNDFSKSVSTMHWYSISSLDVKRQNKRQRAIAVLGNSITDGRGCTNNGQLRWTDCLSRRLLANEATKDVAVLNFGLGGNCVLRGGLGPTGLKRFDRDCLGQEGVKYIILADGINDMGGSWDGMKTAEGLIDANKQFIEKAHAQGIKVFVATMTPFKGNNYYNEGREKGRQAYNEWVRTSNEHDGCIDFDRSVRDTADPARLNPVFLFENDWLHPNAAGYQTLADGIDLNLFK